MQCDGPRDRPRGHRQHGEPALRAGDPDAGVRRGPRWAAAGAAPARAGDRERYRYVFLRPGDRSAHRRALHPVRSDRQGRLQGGAAARGWAARRQRAAGAGGHRPAGGAEGRRPPDRRRAGPPRRGRAARRPWDRRSRLRGALAPPEGALPVAPVPHARFRRRPCAAHLRRVRPLPHAIAVRALRSGPAHRAAVRHHPGRAERRWARRHGARSRRRSAYRQRLRVHRL